MKKVMSNTHLWMLGGCFALGGLVVQAQAATFNWDGGSVTSDNWSDAANWTPDGAPPIGDSTTIVRLQGSTRLTPVVEAPYTLAKLSFLAGADAFSLSGSTLTFSNGSSDGNIIYNASSNTQTIANNLSVNTVTNGPTINASGADLVLNGGISVASGAPSLKFTSDTSAHTITVNGNITGSYGQFQIDVSTAVNPQFVTVLNGNNTFTAQFLLFSGTLKVGNSNALGNGTGGSPDVQFGAGGTGRTMKLLTIAPVTISRNIFIQSGVNSTAAQFSTIGGETADASTFSGNIMLGSNDIANARGAQALTVTAATGGTVTFSGNLLQPVNVFGPASNAALTKTGLGKVILSGANNTYVGTTTVTAGTLQVDGTLTSGGGTVTVNGGATLGGNGVINRAVAVNGDLAPGASIGTLTVDSANFGTGGKLDIELAPGSSDLLAVTGNLDITNATLNLLGLADNVSNYVIATYGSLTVNGGTNGFFNVTGLPVGYSIDYGAGTNSQITLLIPEPATLGLMTLGGLMIASRKRR
ncbi:MAG: autotransporter-associated beta strand repeat-containing protein [Phycisphaerales bacterium]